MHGITLLGSSRGAVLRRGAIKANFIHHLAHAGDESIFRRIGRAYVPSRDWIPASKRKAHRGVVHALNATLAVPSGGLSLTHPGIRALEAFASAGEFWAHVGLSINLTRIWSGDCSFRMALDHIDAALAMEPSWSWGFLLRGDIKRIMIDYLGAENDLRHATELDPTWSWPYSFLSRVLFQKATSVEGLEPLDVAVHFGPNEGFLRCWRGEAYRRMGRFKEAAREIEEGLILDPLYDQGYAWRARLFDSQGYHDDAIASLKKGIAICPLFEKAHRQLVISLRGAGRTAEALRELDRAANLNHRNDWLGLWRADGQADDEYARRALAELDIYLASHPDDAVALAWRGETLTQIGRLTEALTALDGALARKPHNAAALAWRGEAYLRLGRIADALFDLEQSIKLRPDDGRAWAWHGRARFLLGDAVGAESDLTRAIAARRIEYAWIYAWRGEARLALHRPDQARADLDAAAALDPGQGLFFALRAKALAALGDAMGARTDLAQARHLSNALITPAAGNAAAER